MKIYSRSKNRIERISCAIQKEVAFILQRRVDDPRLGVVTISAVQVSKDLKSAKIFVTFLNKKNASEIDVAVLILKRAACFVRFLLANSMCLRVVPVLYFQYDSSLEEGSKMCRLIEKL